MQKCERKRITGAVISLILCITMLLPCFNALPITALGVQDYAGKTSAELIGNTLVWDFSDREQLDDYTRYASGKSGFTLMDGVFKSNGVNGEMKAILKQSFKGEEIRSISVDIIPNGTSGRINAGIYVGASGAEKEKNKINALGFTLESINSADANRIDIVTSSFPTDEELARFVSNDTRKNVLYTDSAKKPLKLMLTFDDNNITVTVSLLDDPAKYTETVYLCDTSKLDGQIGLRSLGSDVAFDNLTIEFVDEDEKSGKISGTTQGEYFKDGYLEMPGVNSPVVKLNKAVEQIPGTIELWVKLDSETERNSKVRIDTLISGYSAKTQDPSAVGDWNLDIRDGKLRYADKTSLGKSGQLRAKTNVPMDEWVHVAVTRMNGQVFFYINGESAGSVNYITYEKTTASYTIPTIGYGIFDTHEGYPSYLDGSIKDIRLWSDARSAEEIKNNMNATLKGDETDLMHYWKLDEKEGTMFRDSAESSKNTGDTEAYTNSGMNNPGWTQWQTSKSINCDVRTMEAWVKVPTAIGDNSRLTIASGYPQSDCHMDIYTKGRPRLFYLDATGKATNFLVEKDLRTNEWTHIAWVIDDVAKSVTCYINGKSVYVSKNAGKIEHVNSLYIGRDNRSGWQYPFMGEVADVRIWSKALSAEEVRSSMNTEKIGVKEGLVLNLPLDDAKDSGEFRDLSGNKNSVINREFGFAWINVEKKPSDYSIAIIPDQQYLTRSWTNVLNGMYTWIGENVEKENIQMVINLGDITDNNGSTQWQRAVHAHTLLQNKVPCLYVPGNHDYYGPYRDLTNMNTYFPLSMFREYDTYGGSYSEDNNLPDDVANVWQEFEVNGNKYLVLSLEFGPRDAVLEWANKVVADHPHHQVIVATHGYMNYDGTRLDGADDYVAPGYNFVKSETEPANDATQMWNKFVKKHANIIMVLSGHIYKSDNIVMRTDIGENGNEVRQFLIDAQALDQRASGLGMVAMMNFSNGGKDVEVTYYCPAKGKYLNYENQFTIKLPAPYREAPDKTEMNSLVEEVEKLKKENYTESSWNAFVKALKAAKTVSADENADETAVLEAVKALEDAVKALKKAEENKVKPNNGVVITAAVSVTVAVLIIAAVIILIAVKKRKKR